MANSLKRWHDEPKDAAHGAVLNAVRTIDAAQWSIYNRLYRQAYLYDCNDNMFAGTPNPNEGIVDENVIKPAVDTAISLVARMRPRVRCQTDGADWGAQRRAVQLESYIEGLF